MTAGRTATDMLWIKAEVGSIEDRALYLVKLSTAGRPAFARDKEIMAGRTIRVCLQSACQSYRPRWVAKITEPTGE